MKKEIRNIDFEIIRKSAKSELTDTENAQLEVWLRAHEQHRQYYKKAVFYIKNGRVFNQSELNVEKAWLNTSKRLDSRQSGKLWLKIVSTVAACFIIVFSVYFINNMVDDKQLMAHQVEFLLPGKKRAELVLSDGQIVTLGVGQDAFKEKDGTVISADSSTVAYLPGEKNAELHMYNEVRVGHGEEFELMLSDGTKVWLNSMSSIRFPVQFGNKKREVEIAGEVYFEVEHDIIKPFVVHTPLHDIEVLGTSFNVSCYPDEEQVHTTLVEGKIQIDNILGKEDEVFVTPGQQFVFNKISKTLIVKEVNANSYISWTEGFFQFEKQSLDEMFVELARWYPIEVEYASEDVKGILFTGKLPRFQSIDTLLGLIEKISDVEFEIVENKIIVT